MQESPEHSRTTQINTASVSKGLWTAPPGGFFLQVGVHLGWLRSGFRKMTPQLSCEKTCGYFWKSNEGGDNGGVIDDLDANKASDSIFVSQSLFVWRKKNRSVCQNRVGVT